MYLLKKNFTRTCLILNFYVLTVRQQYLHFVNDGSLKIFHSFICYLYNSIFQGEGGGYSDNHKTPGKKTTFRLNLWLKLVQWTWDTSIWLQYGFRKLFVILKRFVLFFFPGHLVNIKQSLWPIIRCKQLIIFAMLKTLQKEWRKVKMCNFARRCVLSLVCTSS